MLAHLLDVSVRSLILALTAFIFLGIETKGRSIEEIDAAMTRPREAERAPAR